MTKKRIMIGEGVALELLLGPRREWLGIGRVCVGGVHLRDGSRPLVVRLDTPEGYLYTRYELAGISRRKTGRAEIRFRAFGIPWGRQEYFDEYNQPMVTPGQDQAVVRDELSLHLSPAYQELGGRQWKGFTWSWRFRSRKREIHRLLVDGSWELGGSIVGNTVLSQGQCNRPVYRGARNPVFTTTCLKTLDRYGSPQGVSYQLAPRGGLIQAFDFQSGRDGLLFQYWRRLDSISSVVESPKGDTHLHVLDEYRFPLAKAMETTPQTVLFSPGPVAGHEVRDAWWAAHELVYGGQRQRYGVATTVVRPEAGLKYSTRVHEGRLRVTVGGVEVDSREVPYAIAEHVLPRLAKLGIRRFFPEVMSESDVTVLGLKRKLDDGVHGDLHCASVCATHRFLPSEFWGGLPAWKVMANKARSLGIEIGAWFAPHFAPRAAIFREHPDWIVTDINSLPAGGGYGINTITTVDWNTGILDWVLGDIRRWKEEGGLDYLFTDSWANLGLVQQNYAARMRTNFEALGRLYGEFTRLGLRVFSFEGISPFGVSRFGVADLRKDLVQAVGGIVGQNDLGWWVGEEDMAFGICLCPMPRKRTEEEIRQLQFRLMANRAVLLVDAFCDGLYQAADWVSELNRIYEQALPHMKTRRVLPGRKGVRWDDGETAVVWAFDELDNLGIGVRGMERLTGSGPEPVEISGGPPRLPAWTVHRLSR